jgi:hypothetical protein
MEVGKKADRSKPAARGETVAALVVPSIVLTAGKVSAADEGDRRSKISGEPSIWESGCNSGGSELDSSSKARSTGCKRDNLSGEAGSNKDGSSG